MLTLSHDILEIICIFLHLNLLVLVKTFFFKSLSSFLFSPVLNTLVLYITHLISNRDKSLQGYEGIWQRSTKHWLTSVTVCNGLKKTQCGPIRNPFSSRRHRNNHKGMNIYGRKVKGFTEEGIMNSDSNGKEEVFSKEMNYHWLAEKWGGVGGTGDLFGALSFCEFLLIGSLLIVNGHTVSFFRTNRW